MPEYARAHIQSDRCYRLIPSCYPPIQLYEDLLDPGELELAYAFESLTNDRIRDEVGDIALVSPEERVVGPGSTAIMAAFTQIGMPSRFTDGRFGVYYAGLELDTALEEVSYSQSRRLAASQEPAQVVQTRLYIVGVDAEFVDVRGKKQYQDPNSWLETQALAAELRTLGESGIVYNSVRKHAGQCIAAFKTTALIPPAIQGAHYEFHWDGERISHVSQIIKYPETQS